MKCNLHQRPFDEGEHRAVIRCSRFDEFDLLEISINHPFDARRATTRDTATATHGHGARKARRIRPSMRAQTD